MGIWLAAVHPHYDDVSMTSTETESNGKGIVDMGDSDTENLCTNEYPGRVLNSWCLTIPGLSKDIQHHEQHHLEDVNYIRPDHRITRPA